MAIRVTTLVENTAAENEQLVHEHGLSFFVDTGQARILFDCGAGSHFLDNAVHMNIDLGRLDCVVCSHAHYDHAGGFRPLVEAFPVKRLITGPGFFVPKYRLDGIRHTYLGVNFDESFLTAHGITHEECGDVLEVAPGCWLVGNFSRTIERDTIPANFVIQRDGRFVPDDFGEEICLAFRVRNGLAVLAGCSHPGILNMVTTVTDRLGMPVRGVWGGTHLSSADPSRLDATIAGLKERGVRYFGLSHCSGDAMRERIDADSDLQVCHLRTGDGVFLE